MSVFSFGLLWTVVLLLGSVRSIHRSYLYPHGRGVPDKILPPQDDVSSSELLLKVPIVFYDEIYHSTFINSNGLISFITELAAFFNIQFPLDYPVIAPLYTNVDVRASGAVYYRESQDQPILERATESVKKYFSYAQDFEAKSALIVTWEDVGYHNQGADKVNTFQTIIISDEQDSYVEFLYPENGIQWIKGTGSSSSLPDALAQAGFVSADGRMFTLKGSGSDQISHLNEWSNVGNPGQWLFHVGKIGAEGNVNPPDIHFEEEKETPKSCEKGVFYCHSKALCDDYSTGFCCACQPGSYGNGINCLNEDMPVRVNGKVNGVVNGINITDIILQAYVVPKDGRSYTALSKVAMNIGYDMQSLNVLGTTIGWLFAKPVKGAANGYQLTGGVFNQTITVNYPQTGHQLIIRQNFMGLDVFEQLTMSAEIKGGIPNIPIGSKITIKDYDEQYTRIGPGQLLGHSSQVFQLEGVAIDNTFTVEQHINYHECEHSNTPVHPFRLKVARNFIGYETENIIRYAMNNKVTPLGVDEDPCKEGKNLCGRHSTCIAEGDTFRCVCNQGYQYVVLGETESACLDLDECITGRHTCDANAVCINNQGSFYCECNSGFSGDGTTCNKDKTCDDIRCDYNALCVQRARNMPQCFCKQGFEGNGTYCFPVRHEGSETEQESFDHGASSSQDYRPDSPPDYRQESRPDSDLNYRTHYEPQGVPEHRFDYRPENLPDQRTDFKPDSNTDYRPNYRLDLGPYYRPDYRPDDINNRQDQRTDFGRDYRPDWPGYGDQERYYDVLSPRCAQNICYCPESYSLDESQTKCFRRIDSRREDERVVEGHATDDMKIELQHPQPFCLFPGKCSCPKLFKINNITNTCEFQSENNKTVLDTKGPSGFEISCNVLNRCHPHAQCIATSPSGHYRCECNPGYQGDGIECISSTGQLPFDGDECLAALDCVGEADCIYDTQLGRNTCVCSRGYYKDPISRICVEDKLEDPDRGNCLELRDCHENAACVMREDIGRPDCMCNPGFEGDGRRECRKIQVNCRVFFNCAEGMADCLYDNAFGDFRCRCRQGYEGDGITCTPMLTCIQNASLCGEHASCMPSQIGGYSCRCDAGYIGNGKMCKPEPERMGNFLLLNQGNTMIKVPFHPTTQDPAKPIMMQYSQQSIGIDIDCTENRVYWSDITGKEIESATYLGTDIKKFISEDIQSVEGLAIDWLSRNIYWTDSKKDTVEVASLDNSKLRKVLIDTNLVNPRGIAVHPSRGKLFWSDWNRAAPKIEWSNLDGTNRAIFVEAPAVQLPNSLVIDFATDEVCWADAGTKSIECTGIVNRYARTVTRNCSYPFGLAISQDNYYWTDWTTRKVENIARHGQVLNKPLSVPLVGSAKLYGIVAVPESCPRISNICQHDYGRCPENHLCLPDGGGGRTCVCGLDTC